MILFHVCYACEIGDHDNCSGTVPFISGDADAETVCVCGVCQPQPPLDPQTLRGCIWASEMVGVRFEDEALYRKTDELFKKCDFSGRVN
ncbi:MAG: hypothetical protein PF495_09735 [Spirochaetales bacterium]|jgi:hypothetical protein|nr:hypothetical protein [Spirochaetales bacterium]